MLLLRRQGESCMHEIETLVQRLEDVLLADDRRDAVAIHVGFEVRPDPRDHEANTLPGQIVAQFAH